MSVVHLVWSVLRQSRQHPPVTGGDSPGQSDLTSFVFLSSSVEGFSEKGRAVRPGGGPPI